MKEKLFCFKIIANYFTNIKNISENENKKLFLTKNYKT